MMAAHRNGRANGKVGIALAGGGPLGGIYEVGALLALEEALKGLSLTGCDVYVGVSSGAFVAAGLANGVSPREMHAMFILDRSHRDPFEPNLLLRPALGEFASRLMRTPELIQSAALACLASTPARGLVETSMRLAGALPNGLFDNGPIAAYLARLFAKPGRTDDFRKLPHQLFIVATDLDSAKSVSFGAPGYDDVPISEAVKASSALPGLYPPARIGDHDYVDGVMKKTLHASVALQAGAKLLICVNPLVPFDGEQAARKGGERVRLADRGLITVLSQTFRALIHSRMTVGMERYAREFPDADIVLFEPARNDAVIFFANMFSYSARRRLAEHAYRHTMSELKRRADELEPMLARHDVELDRGAIERGASPQSKPTHRREMWGSLGPLEDALRDIENTLSRKAPGPRQGVKRHADKTASSDA
jgi:NTE family protein